MSSRRVPLYIHISYLFVGLLLVFALISNGYQYLQTRAMMMDEAEQRFDLVGRRAIAELDVLYRPTAITATLLAKSALARATSLEQRLQSLPALLAALRSQPAVASLYVGYANGDFFLVRPWHDEPALQPLFTAPPGTAWVVQSVEVSAGQPPGEYLYLAADLQVLERRPRPDYLYDPRSRPWYELAMQGEGLGVTAPYLFFTSRVPGVTFTYRGDRAGTVAGVDVNLSSLNDLLRELRPTPDSRLVLVNAKGEIVGWHAGQRQVPAAAASKTRLAELSETDAPLLWSLLGEVQRTGHETPSFMHAGEQWQGARIDVPTLGGQTMTLLLASPHRELLARAIALRDRGVLIAAALLVLGVLAALGLSRTASRPLQALTAEAAKIERFDFEAPLAVESRITEVVDLAHAMGSMKATIQRFLELSIALSSETNFQRLLARLLVELQLVTGAAGGLIYLADSGGHRVQLARACRGERLLEEVSAPALELDASGHPLVRSLERHQPYALTVEELRAHFPLFADLQRPLTLWALPLRSRTGELLGVLALLVDEREHRLDAELRAFAEALSTTAAVALNTQRLLDEQKVLLEAIIQLVAGAIDAKSPYTGGHCQRVPELTKMLARAACAEREGPFRDFDLSEQEWEQLRIAAWLHDCGKVTTPEYVVDKATKLETLYDRIHEVRMRFEVLKRDAELEYWQALAAGGEAADLRRRLDGQLRTLDEEFTFVAQCNEGGESMAPERVERLQRIASRTWRRTLSDRLGISHEELERKSGVPEPALPVLEPLLADKPEHLFVRGPREQMPADNPWGFKVEVPEHLYNRGELYNLRVERGTLSEEERYKINEHIIQTIIMLEKLPFPRHLRRVPEIAGGHHEKMDGTGYPKRLVGEQMSLPARMIAIADIFEALTAIDRPYKKGKTLSETIGIMSRMCRERHIDPELFALFLRSGVYREYAERYMPRELVDEVQIAAYL